MVEISVVIPVYNEENRIVPTLKKIKDYLEKKSYPYEIIVVDDGSKDRTPEIIREIREKDNRVSLIRFLKNRGKGAVVKEGVLSAKGDYILFTDSDLSTPIEELDKLIFYIKEKGYDIAIGSRGLPESRILIPQPWYRRYIGRWFPFCVRLIIMRGIADTQCGFKLFKKDVGQRLFKLQKISGFSFDVEILYLARRFKYRVKEVPVTWINSPQSRVNLFSEPFKMLLSLFQIRLHYTSLIPKFLGWQEKKNGY